MMAAVRWVVLACSIMACVQAVIWVFDRAWPR